MDLEGRGLAIIADGCEAKLHCDTFRPGRHLGMLANQLGASTQRNVNVLFLDVSRLFLAGVGDE